METVFPFTWIARLTWSQIVGISLPLSSRVAWFSNPRIGASRIQDGPPSRSIIMNRIREYFTSSALIVLPSWNLTPWRTLKVYVRPSLEMPPLATVGTSVASMGTYWSVRPPLKKIRVS